MNTVSKFRLPVYPVISENGEHWKQLYRRMHTDTRLYNWGSNKSGLLGDDIQSIVPWPTEITDRPFRHAVADIVCGGYFTAVLTTAGEVWIKSGSAWCQSEVSWNRSKSNPSRQARTIKQISATRDGIVCLAESGAMWYCHWQNREAELVDTDIRVVKGGWSGFSAMRTPQRARDEDSGVLVWSVTNGTDIELPPREIDFTRPSEVVMERSWGRAPRQPDYDEVTNWAMLRDYIVYVTKPGRVWAWRIGSVDVPQELMDATDCAFADVADVYGWLEKFALLLRNGEVLIGTGKMLEDLFGYYIQNLEFEKIPALQNSGVIKIAFGDWHYHALHKDGTITSYGHEPEGCGAFGFGDANFSVIERGFSQDIVIRPECLTTGRRVHFEPGKKAWQLDLAMAYKDEETDEVFWPADDTRYEVSEWIEERLRAWATPGNEDMLCPRYEVRQEESGNGARQADIEHDETPAYFVTSVAACGWHSAALVLVDTAKAAEVARQYAEVQGNGTWAAPPRLQLLNGTIMPGEGPVSTWSSASGCPKPQAVEIVRF